jgi:ADP-heptose:LPS heptosyltransferase
MTAPAATSEARVHDGRARCPGTALHTVPLGYDRKTLPVGQQLPVPPSVDLAARIAACSQIEIALHGKLGDSLLALSAVRAVAEWIALRRRLPVPITITGPYTHLFARTTLARIDLLSQSQHRQAIVADRAGADARGSEAGTLLLVDPEQPPCWSTDGFAMPDLPARHYLALERRLGLRLPAERPFTPMLFARPNTKVQQLQANRWIGHPTIAAITATSWPKRKDFGAERYIETAERISHHLGTPVRLLLIGGKSNSDTEMNAEPARSNVHILHLDGMPVDDLVDLLPQTNLVLGNDTGLTHLAALARNPDGTGPHVIGLHARHSHSKWRTGLPHHHAIATPASERMHQGDLCPVRDRITQAEGSDITAITPATLAGFATHLLAGTP